MKKHFLGLSITGISILLLFKVCYVIQGGKYGYDCALQKIESVDTAVTEAAVARCGGKLQVLLETEQISKETLSRALNIAVCNNRVNNANLLLEHGADITYKSHENRTLLHEAVDILTIAYAFNGDGEMIDLLMKWGVNVNAQDRRGDTVLHYAARRSGLEEASSKNGREKGNSESLLRTKVLTKLMSIPGIDTHIKNKDGQTAIDIAAGHDKNLVNILKQG